MTDYINDGFRLSFTLKSRIFTINWEPFEELIAIRCGPSWTKYYEWEEFCFTWMEDMSNDEPTLPLAAAEAWFQEEEERDYLVFYSFIRSMFNLMWECRLNVLTSGGTM